MSAHGMSEAGGLREAVEALAGKYDEYGRQREAVGRPAWPNNVARDLRALLAAHPAEADPTAGERRWAQGACTTYGCPGDPRYAAPGRQHIAGCRYPLGLATPDAGDGRLDAHIAAAEHPTPACRDCEVGEPHVCPLVEPDAGDASEHHPTTPVQCSCGWRETDPDAGTWVGHMGAKARAEAGEQALLDAADDLHSQGLPIAAYRLRDRAARIARGVTR